jgi:hypothetical protein
MGWLFDILLDLICALFPSWGGQEPRSTMGESRMDRQARIIASCLVGFIIVAAVAIWWFVR